MKRYKYLLKNVVLLTLGNFTTKLVSFFLVPLYTSYLSTEQYGVYDYIGSVINLLIPILTLEITNAVLRFTVEKNVDPEEQQQVFRIGIRYLFYSAIVVLILLMVNGFIQVSELIHTYQLYFFLLYLSISLNQFMLAYARGMNCIIDVSAAGIMGAFVCVALNIYFLVYRGLGLEGYFIANIAGDTCIVLYIFIRMKIWRCKLFSPISKKLRSQMLSYSIPLILSSVSWWINNLSDRYIVIWLCGAAANGIYSVGYKIPQILNAFQQVFYNAWVLSSIKEYNSKDRGYFYSIVYNLYNYGMIVLCFILIILSRFIAYILYAKDFYVAWRYVPFLLISIVFGAMCGALNGVFYACKATRAASRSVLIGAGINTILNICLVKLIGPLGASIATAIGYAVVWMVRVKDIKRYVEIPLQLRRDIMAYGILVIQAVLMLMDRDTIEIYGIQVICLLIIVILFREETKLIVRKIRNG